MSSQALTDKILKTAKAEAEQILNDAYRRAGESEKIMLSQAETECAAIYAEAEEKAKQAKNAAELMSGLAGRKAILHAQRDMLDKAYKTAFERLLSLPDAKRREHICALIIKYAPEAVITVSFNSRDIKLFDEKTVSSLNAALSDRFGCDACVTVSDKPEAFRGGVYMRGAKCDADASYEALFDDLRERNDTEVAACLFSEE